MMDAITISLSGLGTEQKRVGVAANNIANAEATGAATPTSGKSAAYTPQDVVAVTGPAGGVMAQVKDRDPAFEIAYQPTDPYADDQGRVAVPNIDLLQEMMTFKQAELAYKANAKVLKAASDMQDAALKIFDEKV